MDTTAKCMGSFGTNDLTVDWQYNFLKVGYLWSDKC